ncbi:MAG: hypothetical protein M1830_002098 [Pleopsidium flavum]|nr:MAG: hypothetical protein M1830_002098 [Pleopsidium flavum]
MGGIKFNPEEDIPDLSGKVVLVTGGTTGLGSRSVLALAKHRPERIYFSGRYSNRAAALISEIKTTVPNANLTFVECDLASLASVKAAAQHFTSQRLDILMCNAGVMAQPPRLTKDGYEVQFGTNHLGHALLIKLLLSTLIQTAELPNADVRIVILTSLGFRGHPTGGISFKDLRTVQDLAFAGGWVRYRQSKLANILYAAELGRRYPNITSVSIHPGVVATGLVGNLSFANKMLVYATNLGKVKTPAEGAYNQLWAAASEKGKGEVVNGAFYEPIGVPGKHDKESQSEKLAGELWEWTQREL